MSDEPVLASSKLGDDVPLDYDDNYSNDDAPSIDSASEAGSATGSDAKSSPAAPAALDSHTKSAAQSDVPNDATHTSQAAQAQKTDALPASGSVSKQPVRDFAGQLRQLYAPSNESVASGSHSGGGGHDMTSPPPSASASASAAAAGPRGHYDRPGRSTEPVAGYRGGGYDYRRDYRDEGRSRSRERGGPGGEFGGGPGGGPGAPSYGGHSSYSYSYGHAGMVDVRDVRAGGGGGRADYRHSGSGLAAPPPAAFAGYGTSGSGSGSYPPYNRGDGHNPPPPPGYGGRAAHAGPFPGPPPPPGAPSAPYPAYPSYPQQGGPLGRQGPPVQQHSQQPSTLPVTSATAPQLPDRGRDRERDREKQKKDKERSGSRSASGAQGASSASRGGRGAGAGGSKTGSTEVAGDPVAYPILRALRKGAATAAGYEAWHNHIKAAVRRALQKFYEPPSAATGEGEAGKRGDRIYTSEDFKRLGKKLVQRAADKLVLKWYSTLPPTGHTSTELETSGGAGKGAGSPQAETFTSCPPWSEEKEGVYVKELVKRYMGERKAAHDARLATLAMKQQSADS